jgi:hypothetical protein
MRGTADGVPYEGALAVGVYRLAVGNEIGGLRRSVDGLSPSGSTEVVELPVAPSVRWMAAQDAPGRPGSTDGTAVIAEFYVPVPETPDQVVVLTFSSRGAPVSGAVLSTDAMAETFGFTFDHKTPLGPVLFWLGRIGTASRPQRGKVW